MRRTRRLILVLLTVLIAGVGILYTVQKETQARSAPAAPATLPASISAHADDWQWENTRDGKPLVRVRARDFRQSAEANRLDLTGVELHLFHKDGSSYDRVRSEKADFDLTEGVLFSDGEVEITMGVPADGVPAGRLVVIRTSGVRFESQSGKAWTDRHAKFEFDRGEGESVGALYNPATRELQMYRDVRLRWRGEDPKTSPMIVEAGSLLYNEAASEVLLSPWSKFQRDTLSMEGGNAVVKLEEGAIRSVDAIKARGVDKRPDRTLDYSADTLRIRFGEDHVLEHLTGETNARLVSTAATSSTSIRSDRIDMEFAPDRGESLLRRALATGAAVIESHPLPRKGQPPADTRILKSQIVALHMRENGEEIDRVETDSPGHLEFVPNRPNGRRRSVDAERMTIHYGADNQVRSFTAVEAATRTEHPPVPGRKTPQPPALTWSKGLAAHFEEKSGAMVRMEQWDNFRYEEGDRQAKADRADFETASDRIVLTGKSRVQDASGSTEGERITLNQKTNDFEAVGSVASTRLPDRKAGQQKGGMLSGEEPVQARADRMTGTGDNTLITYEGNALLWQGANRITAQQIRIDRKANRLTAAGEVVTRLLEKTAPAQKKHDGAEFTIVRAPALEYEDKTRLAHYRGGVTLVRGATTVTAQEIRAWLAEANSNSSLERAFADGNVRIVQNTAERNRTGTSEHAEFYTADNRIVLTGGQPAFRDSVKGSTSGTRITYYSDADRLQVEGESKKPVETRILRRPG